MDREDTTPTAASPASTGSQPGLLSPLDPTQDTARWSALQTRLASAARPELARRRRAVRVEDPDALLLLSGWLRPTLYATAAAAAFAIGVLTLAPTESGPGGSDAGIADALGWPAQVAGWIEGGGEPPAVDELIALDLSATTGKSGGTR